MDDIAHINKKNSVPYLMYKIFVLQSLSNTFSLEDFA
jgi:hypothetical protein